MTEAEMQAYAGRLFTDSAESEDIVPVPAQGPPEFLFMGFRAFKRQ